jgi:hypothetical protein
MPHVHALANLPQGLRDPLLEEFNSIVRNYFEHRWFPTELSGGKFCEIVYTILDGHAKGSFASAPSKPANFVMSCRSLENNVHVPRSFQILIPRLLPGLYEIRNNRGVGHVGGDVDPNHMDATVVLSLANWIMAELVRIFHGLTNVAEAQVLVDSLAERKLPLVWQIGSIKRVLDPKLQLKDKVLLLLAASPGIVATKDLFHWTDYSNRIYFNKLLKEIHSERLVELSTDEKEVQLLPPGVRFVERTFPTQVLK